MDRCWHDGVWYGVTHAVASTYVMVLGCVMVGVGVWLMLLCVHVVCMCVMLCCTPLLSGGDFVQMCTTLCPAMLAYGSLV